MSAETATVAEQEYLETIFWLYEAGLPMTGANVARAMQLSAPTVHEMIGRLERDGYITRGTDRALAFTDSGREHAEHIVRRHRMIERFLTDVLGIPWNEVHEEAERIEHAMSPVLEERMFAAIGDAKTCPHGHPIDASGRIQGVPLADCEPGAAIQILRFENEAEELLHYLHDHGVHPGMEGSFVAAGGDEVTIELGGDETTLTRSVAETVSVVADPRRRRASRCPSSSCSRRTATGAEAPRPRRAASRSRPRAVSWGCARGRRRSSRARCPSPRSPRCARARRRR